MNMKIKKMILATIILNLFTSITANATTISVAGENYTNSVTAKDYNDAKKVKTTYLYENEINSTRQLIYNKTFNKAEVNIFGQLFYWTINNNSNIKDFSTLRNSSNSYSSMFDIRTNLGNYTSAGSYGTVYGYPASYPSGGVNYNFKDNTEDPFSRVVTTDSDPKFINYNGKMGVPRNVFNKDMNYNSYISFPDDYNWDLANWDYFNFSTFNMLAFPSISDHSIPFSRGYANTLYYNTSGDWIGNSTLDINNDKDKALIETYQAFYNLYAKWGMDALLAKEGLTADSDITSQIKVFLKYFETDFATEQTYGQAMAKYSSGGLFYFTLSIPKHYVPRNLKIADINNPIGTNKPYVVDKDTNQPVDPKTPLVSGKTYTYINFAGFENNEVLLNPNSVSKTTYNKPILTNFYMLTNNSNDYSNAEITQDAVQGDKTDSMETYMSKAFDYSTIDDSKLNKYSVDFTVPDTDKSGNKVNSVNLRTAISTIAPVNSYYTSKIETSDNCDLTDDNGGISYKVIQQPKDVIVAHKPNTASPNTIYWNNTNINMTDVKISKLDGTVLDSSSVLYPNDKIVLDCFVGRDPQSGSDNPATLGDLQLYYMENINPTSNDLSIKLDNSYKTYDYKKNNSLKIVKYWAYDKTTKALTQHDYNSATNGSIKYESGMIVDFQAGYTIPSFDDINTDTTKWNTLLRQIYQKASLEKLGLMFQLEDGSSSSIVNINQNVNNDWTSDIMTCGDPLGRNLVLNKIRIFDENKILVKEIYITDANDLISNVDIGTLDSSMNYYAEVETKFTYPNVKGDKTSINKDIKTNVINYFNNLPPDDGTISTGKFMALSNLQSNWKDSDIGLYSPTNGRYNTTNIKTYNPSKDAFNPLVIPLKGSTATNGTMKISIPNVYNPYLKGNLNPNDNCFLNAWENVTLTYQVGKSTSKTKDNAVVNIQLFDSSNTEYKTAIIPDSGDPTVSYFSFDPLKNNYHAIITVKRLSGSDSAMQDLNPSLDVTYKLIASGTVIPMSLKPWSPNKDLKNINDTVQYYLDNLTSQSLIDIKAVLNIQDSDMSNNQIESAWISYYNFAVTNFKISPTTIDLGQSEYSHSQGVSFGADITFDAYGQSKQNTTNAQNVDIEIREMKKSAGTTDYAYDGNIVYHKQLNLAEGQVYNLQDTFKNGQPLTFVPSQYRYVIAVNGGIAGNFVSRKYIETTLSDNEDTQDLEVRKTIPQQVIDCSSLRISNTWATTFYWTDYTGQLHQREVHTKNGSYTVYWCAPLIYHYHAPQKVSFNENYSISAIKFASESTNGATVDLLKNPSAGTVRAGQWFTVSIEVNYNTNRNSGMPLPNPYYKDMCNYITRTPSYSAMYRNTNYINAEFNISGSQDEKYSLVRPSSTSGDSDNLTLVYTPFPKRYVPTTTTNLNMVLNVQTQATDGYIYDYTHPSGKSYQLKDCKSVTIKVDNPLPIQAGTSSVD